MVTFLSTELEIGQSSGRSNAQGTPCLMPPLSTVLVPMCTHKEHQILSTAEAASFASQFWGRKVHTTKASQHEFLATCIDVDSEKNVKHAGCCKPAVRGSFARLPGRCQVTCTHSAPPERATGESQSELLRTTGLCGASGAATARGMILYADMIAACWQKEAASNTGTSENAQKSQTCRQYSMQTQMQTLFTLSIPHIPLPPELSVGTNEAIMAPTPENPPSWHNWQSP